MAGNFVKRQLLKARGFTLLEVLVALVILGLVLGGLFGEIQNQVDNRYRLQERYVAQTVAWNRLLDQYQLLEGWSPLGANELGEATGDFELMGKEWFWELEVQETFGEDFYRYQVDSYTNSDRDDPSSGSLVAYYIAD